ncbi:MAG: UbiA family prenyltransferase [Rhodothermales bacterium]|nr:UbiA family prenyltransferase [Rhodothermales bacterium]MBO6778513.1 UbiA family prenyltransferase [Rhodothermales bacterium]
MPENTPTVLQWLRFLRWPNLAIIALTMVLVRWTGMGPLLGNPGVWGVSHLAFAGMVLATLLIAAAGYVANDIVDRGIDEINKPGRVFIGRAMRIEQAWSLTAGLIVAAAVCLLPLVRQVGFYWWMTLYPVSAVLLIAYAFRLKCVPVAGNVVVSLLSAFVPLLVLSADRPALAASNLAPGTALISGFALFAFLASLFREVVKDLEDVSGDEVFGCRTLAVIARDRANLVAQGAAVMLLVAVLAFLVMWPLGGWLAWLIGVVGVGMPTGVALVRVRAARMPAEYARVSLLAKLTMLGGLLMLPALSGAV